jgi:hypothetical protein
MDAVKKSENYGENILEDADKNRFGITSFSGVSSLKN